MATDIILPYLAYLIEFMFTNGIFPYPFKVTKVIPIYKAGSKHVVKIQAHIPTFSIFKSH